MSKWLIALIALVMCLVIGERLYREGKMLHNSKSHQNVTVLDLKKLAERGNRKAQYRLARCYDRGVGVKENDSLAFQWYMKAAQQGSGKAMYHVGKCYKDGEGITKDLNLAFAWFSKAAQDGNENGQYALGKCYMKGEGVAKDYDKARAWLIRAIRNPNGGTELLLKIKENAVVGDVDAETILRIIK